MVSINKRIKYATYFIDIFIHQIHGSKNRKTEINKQQYITESSATCTQHDKLDVTKAILLQSRQCKHIKTRLKFLYTLGTQYTGHGKTKEILVILNSLDIFSYK